MDIVERGLSILKMLGLDYEWYNKNYYLIWISNPKTGERGKIRFGAYEASYLLDFLMNSGKLKLDEQSGDDAEENLQARERFLQRLNARTRVIGTTILIDRAQGGFIYIRPRHKIPGAQYMSYFYLANALEPARNRYQGREFYFASEELKELERWVTHDEKIFAECNQQYSVQQD